jgi:hypothetical protein
MPLIIVAVPYQRSAFDAAHPVAPTFWRGVLSKDVTGLSNARCTGTGQANGLDCPAAVFQMSAKQAKTANSAA